MIITEISKKKIVSTVVLILLFFITLTRIDYTGLQTFSLKMAIDVSIGLGHPDWSFVYDGSGEDLVSLLILTVAIACLGTSFATVLAIPVTLFSAVNLWPSAPFLTKIGKLGSHILRAFPELILAIIFVKVLGPGPFAGVMAIGVHQIGMLSKLFTEELESMDEKLIESMDAVGANFWQKLFYVRIPSLLPIYSSLILNHVEIAIRSAATLGLVGAGGIGAPLIFAIQTRNWSKVSILLIGVVLTIFVLDQVTELIRKKLR